MTPLQSVAVCGPVSWNHLIYLDHLPAPVPHMQHALRDVHTVGGTSAGKALHLQSLGVPVQLHTQIGGDPAGQRVLESLHRAGIDTRVYATNTTERHVNLMTDRGERVSLYVSIPSRPADADLLMVEDALRHCDIVVIDLSELGVALLDRQAMAGWAAPVWVDLHDYDGQSAYHEPFLRAADVVFMNDDKTNDPWALLRHCISRGPALAVCTRGARGAVALDTQGNRASVEAIPTDVVDTNGAGDAFMAGFLAGQGTLEDRLLGGALAASLALTSVHLHPVLE